MKLSKSRERMRTAAKQTRQTTFDELPPAAKRGLAISKQIVITEIDAAPREDELALKVSFKLLPSKTAFSKITAYLWFDGQQLDSCLIRVLQGPLATNDFELNPVLDMSGVAAGNHTVKVEMYESWGSEKIAYASREVTVDFVLHSRDDQLMKIPTVKRVAGAHLAIVSESEKAVYREIEETEKKERSAKRDEW